MAEWRFLRGWTDAELERRLRDAAASGRNFGEAEDQMTPDRGWSRHYSEAVIGYEPCGPPCPGGPFERSRPFVERYAFSDPRIVRGHFDAAAPLLGRVMLLEVRVLGLRYLNAVEVTALREHADGRRSERGFRYDTLAGHIERGCEWFLIAKDHETGAVTFRIDAGWQRGDLPNAWSRLGFRLLARRYQRAWHRLAHQRLRTLLGSSGLAPLPRGARLVHAGWPLPAPSVQATASGPAPVPITSEHETPGRRAVEAS